MTGRALVGTSGYSYPHWRGVLYPEGLPRRLWLSRYAELFDGVEINATFYGLPRESTVRRWVEQTPEHFVFAVKGSRFITHVKRLRSAKEAIDRFFEAVRPLGRKLGPVLWQLPPQLGPDPERLSDFLALLPRGRHVVEFRNPACHQQRMFQVLEDRGAALCTHDLIEAPVPEPPPGPFAYRRFHGATAPYQGRYGRARLRREAAWVEARVSEGRDVYAFFNNDILGFAVLDALDLRRLLAERGISGASGLPARGAGVPDSALLGEGSPR